LRMEIQLLIHATEDENKVVSSLRKIVYFDEKEIQRYDLTGHYKNPIKMYKITIKENTRVLDIIKKILAMLTEADKTLLTQYLDEYIYRNKLFLRLDKPSLCKGKVTLGETDPIRIVVSGVRKEALLKLIKGG